MTTRSLQQRRLAVLTVALLGLTAALLTPIEATASETSSRASVERALANPKQLIATPWRDELAPKLRQLPEWQQAKTITDAMSGRIIAGVVRLPKTLHLKADTTILADVVELQEPTARIVTGGHDFTLLPWTAVRKKGEAGGRAEGGEDATAAEVLIIEASSTAEGYAGTIGFTGTPDGSRGDDGAHGSYDSASCTGEVNGEAGKDGQAGAAGGNGGQGGPGGDGGAINLAIPQGSQDFLCTEIAWRDRGSGRSGGARRRRRHGWHRRQW